MIEPPCPPGPDAGGTTSSASSANGVGVLSAIGGSLICTQFTAFAADDYEDMFKIRVCDAANFSARASANFDTQLWLFDAEGRGVLGNDDANVNEPQARIFPPADDGTNQTLPGPGVYYLAISGRNNDPLSGGAAIFHQESTTERSGPDGPGGGDPITEWSGGGETGSYMIYLQGTAFLDDDCKGDSHVTEPLVPAVSDWGLLSLGIVLLSGGTIVLARR